MWKILSLNFIICINLTTLVHDHYCTRLFEILQDTSFHGNFQCPSNFLMLQLKIWNHLEWVESFPEIAYLFFSFMNLFTLNKVSTVYAWNAMSATLYLFKAWDSLEVFCVPSIYNFFLWSIMYFFLMLISSCLPWMII